MPTSTIRLHRVLRAKPERVYRAFLNPEAMAKWLPPYGFTCAVHARGVRSALGNQCCRPRRPGSTRRHS
jgi:uncharacterized protein YndB with AHSA1/START domain